MFAVLSSKFIQDAMYQLLSESAEFYKKYDKKILAYFFLGHGVCFIRRLLLAEISLRL